jgi:hypothetical protein
MPQTEINKTKEIKMSAQSIKEFMCPSRIINSSGSFGLSDGAIAFGETGPMPISMDATQIQSFDSSRAGREPLIIRNIEDSRPDHSPAASAFRTRSFLGHLRDWAIAGMRWGRTWERGGLRLRRIYFQAGHE